MTSRRSRSKTLAIQAILPESAQEDPSLEKRTVFFSISSARPCGTDLAIRYSYYFWVKTAMADGSKRGRIFGRVKDCRHSYSIVTGEDHVTDKIVAYYDNIIKTKSGALYRIESLINEESLRLQEEAYGDCFTLTHLEGKLMLLAAP